MAYKDFRPGDTVQHQRTKRRGQVVKNHYEVCKPKNGQIAVVFEGDEHASCVHWTELIREVN